MIIFNVLLVVLLAFIAAIVYGFLELIILNRLEAIGCDNSMAYIVGLRAALIFLVIWCAK